MKTILLSFILSLSCFVAHAQKECGTLPPPEAEYDRSLAKSKMSLQPQLLPTKFIRVFIVDFLNNTGTDSSWTKEQIRSEFQLAKDLMKPYDICLVLEGFIKSFAN